MRIHMFAIAVCSCLTANAQQVAVNLEEAIEQALQKNKIVEAAAFDVAYQQQIRRTATDVGKTSVVYMKGQYNSYVKGDNNFTITQDIPFPTVFTSQIALGNSLVLGSELRKTATENELAFQVKQVYYQLVYLASREELLLRQDSIYNNFVKATELRYRAGETRLLENTTAESQRDEARNQLAQTQADILVYQKLLESLMNSDQPVTIVIPELTERRLILDPDTSSIWQNPQLAYIKQQIAIASAEKKVAAAKVMPDITIGYFNQTLIGTPVTENGSPATMSNRFQGFLAGIAIPLWFGPEAAKVNVANLKLRRTQSEYDYNRSLMEGRWRQAVQEYLKNKNSVNYYRSSALLNAELMLNQSELAFRNGEINYTEYWLAIQNSIRIRENYLQSLNNLNQSVVMLEFLAGLK